MVSRITYRPFDEDDFEALSDIVREAWYAHFPSRELGILAAKNDLAYMLSIATFSQIALVDGEARGIVLTCSNAARKTTNRRWQKISENYLRQLRELDPIIATEHWATIELTGAKNNRMLQKSGFAGTSEISLLAVSADARGMGLGTVLIDAATSHLAAEGARKAFLYTDTDCTWSFYEHRGFKRAGSYRATRDERRLLPKELYVYGINLVA